MREFEYEIGDKTYRVVVEEIKGSEARIKVNDETFQVRFTRSGPGRARVKQVAASTQAPAPEPATAAPAPSRPAGPVSAKAITAPMPGVVLDIKVAAGDTVSSGDVLLILEAMKMENEIRANRDGKIKAVRVEKGSRVNTGEVLIEFE